MLWPKYPHVSSQLSLTLKESYMDKFVWENMHSSSIYILNAYGVATHF